MSEKRRDSKGRILRTEESQRKDGRYLYKYVDANGKPQSVYSWKLVATDKVPAGKRDCIALREKEQGIHKDLADGISTDEIIILLKTGLRISEFCGLTVNDIDFRNGVVNIDHQLLWEKGEGGGYYIDTPKSKGSIRKVPMSAEACKAFERVIARRGEPEPFMEDGYSGFLFVKEFGEPYPAHHYQEVLHRIVQKYNKGHDDKLPNITLNLYAHASIDNVKAEVVNLIA